MKKIFLLFFIIVHAPLSASFACMEENWVTGVKVLVGSAVFYRMWRMQVQINALKRTQKIHATSFAALYQRQTTLEAHQIKSAQRLEQSSLNIASLAGKFMCFSSNVKSDFTKFKKWTTERINLLVRVDKERTVPYLNSLLRADKDKTKYLNRYQRELTALNQHFAHFKSSIYTAERRRTSALFVCAPFAVGFGRHLQKEGHQSEFLRSIVNGLLQIR